MLVILYTPMNKVEYKKHWYQKLRITLILLLDLAQSYQALITQTPMLDQTTIGAFGCGLCCLGFG